MNILKIIEIENTSLFCRIRYMLASMSNEPGTGWLHYYPFEHDSLLTMDA